MIEGKKEKEKIHISVNNNMYEVSPIVYKIVAYVINHWAKKCSYKVYHDYINKERSKTFKGFKAIL